MFLLVTGFFLTLQENRQITDVSTMLGCFFLIDGTERTLPPLSYETQMESELSYEMILALEAADENSAETLEAETGTSHEKPHSEAGEESTESERKETEAEEQEESEQEESEAAETEVTGGEEAGETEKAEETVETAGLATEKVVDYPVEKLGDYDYLIQNFYQVDSSTTITSSELNATELLAKNMTLNHDASTPQILIYHTHGHEGYVDSVEGDYSTGIIGVGDYLTELLTNQYGLNVIHHTGIYDTDRDTAYSRSGPALEKLLEENPSIEVVIDLHRDGVGENTRLVTTQNGVEMAKIMFFNGLSRLTKTGDITYLPNPYIQDNLALSMQMQLAAAEYYPDFTRRIYLKGYRYNMQYCPKTMLIEVGAQTNTLEEAKNAMVPLADILNKVLTGTR